jgi:hypothetical protein
MEPFKDKKTILDVETVKDTLSSSIVKPLTVQKKPVKFTWDGLLNFGVSLSNTPIGQYNIQSLIDNTLPRATDIVKGRKKPQEKDYIDFFEDMEKSIFGAAQNIGYSIGDLLTTGTDLALDTNLTEALDKAYEENKIADPETLLGTVNKILIEYGAPGGAVFKIMNRAKKLFKSKKAIDAKKAADLTGQGSKLVNTAKRVGYMSTAFAATDFITSGARSKTQDPMLMDAENEEGLQGRDLALARFRNKLRFGAEGALIGGGFALMGGPLARIATVGAKYGLFKPAGYALRGIDLLAVRPATYLAANIPGSAAAGKALRNASSYVIDKSLATVITGNPTKQLPAFEKWRLFSVESSNPLQRRLKKIDNFLSGFRSVGKYTGLGFQLSSDAKRFIKGRARTIEKYLESIEKKSYDLAKSFEGQYNTLTTSPASKDYYLDQVLAYLKGQAKLSELPKILQGSAQNLQKEIMKTKDVFGNLLPEGDLKKFILNNLKTYMRKSFSVFTNPEYMPDQKIKQGAAKWILENVVKKNKDLRESALTLKTGKMTKAQAESAYAESLVHKILTNTKQDGVDPLKLIQNVSKNILRSDKLIKTGEELPDAIKKLLGEENNLKSAVLQTTSHAITQATNKLTLDKLAKTGLDEGWLFKSEADAIAANSMDAVKIGEIKNLGILKSGISKLYATKDMAAALKGAPGKFDGLLQSSAYRNILQFKVATQFGKTVLSPATQVRNVTSASMFPLANGHIGGRASVTESIKMVMDDIFGAGKVIDEKKFIDNLENKIRLGVIDENIVASELQAVLKDIRAGAKVKNLDSLLARLAESRMIKTATRIYAGGDNLWKWYGHEYVKSQMRAMYKNVDDIAKWTKEITGRNFDRVNTFTGKVKTFDEAIDEAAAWQIRNTYPTYSKVPEVIKNLRKLPFGNFVSFPAEMIRTTHNIVSIGLKEATSSNAQLRQQGYRRLLGAFVTLGGAEKGVSALAQNLTGVTMDQIEAYKRSLSAPWDSRAAILPVNTWKDGKGKAINFSYFSPYDVITQPIRAALKTLEEGKLKQQDADVVAFNLFLGADGPVRKLLDPFVSESIALERVSDVIPSGLIVGGRGGVTKTGKVVYSETDDGPTAFMKSLVHIIEGVQPTAITTGDKIIQGIEKDVKRGGTPVSLQDELLALFSGVRIINVDVPKAMQFKVTDYNKKFRSVTKAEGFFSLVDFQNRGPLVMADEFRNIQNETFRVNQDFYFILQDAIATGVKERDLLKILRDRNISYSKAKKLLKGKNIPYTAFEERMKKRVKEAEKIAKERGEKINKEYFYPKKLFRNILKEFKNKDLNIKEDSQLNEIEKILKLQSDKLSSLPQKTEDRAFAELQTPPLPVTPQPNVNVAAANTVPNTNLTRTQLALLSPEEQIIASRSRT